MNKNAKVWCSSHFVRNTILNLKNKTYIWFLNKFIAKEDEYYGIEKPSVEWMILHNKTFWIQPCNEEEA